MYKVSQGPKSPLTDQLLFQLVVHHGPQANILVHKTRLGKELKQVTTAAHNQAPLSLHFVNTKTPCNAPKTLGCKISEHPNHGSSGVLRLWVVSRCYRSVVERFWGEGFNIIFATLHGTRQIASYSVHASSLMVLYIITGRLLQCCMQYGAKAVSLGLYQSRILEALVSAFSRSLACAIVD